MKTVYLATVTSCLGMLSYGICFGWSSPSLPLLLGLDSPVPLTSYQATWVTSCQTLGAVGGALLCTYVINIIGRKWTMLLTAVPGIVSWLMIAYARSVWELYIARLACGLSTGSGYTSVIMYTGEISPARIRGILTSALTLAAKFGIFFEWSIGPFLSVRDLALTSMSLPILFALAVIWVPESPYHLMRRGRYDEAVQNLARLRGTKDVVEEAKLIEKSVKVDLASDTGLRELVTVSGNRKALIVVVTLVLIQQWSGSMAVLSYAQLIFAATGNSFEDKYVAMIVGVVQFFCALISTLIVDSLDRRVWLMASTLGTGLSTAVVGTFFYLQSIGMDVSNIVWTPAIGTMFYIFTYAVGLAGLPFTMISEVFPTNVKALGSTIAVMCCNAFAFSVTFAYLIIDVQFGKHTAFWLYAAVSFVGMLFVYFYVPETRRKTLQEVQNQLHGRKIFIARKRRRKKTQFGQRSSAESLSNKFSVTESTFIDGPESCYRSVNLFAYRILDLKRVRRAPTIENCVIMLGKSPTSCCNRRHVAVASMSNTRLYAVASMVSLSQLSAGMFLEWPSQMIPKLMAEDSSFKLDEDEYSWIMSLLTLGMAVGCIAAIYVVDFAGRKISMLVTIGPTIVGWSLTTWDSTIAGLYVAHFIGGIGSGLMFTAGLMYVTEISPPEVRGAVGSCYVVMNYVGAILGYIIGSFASISEYAYVAMSFAMIQFLMLIWLHETPYYLLRQKRLGAALDSLMFLRGSGGVSEEMDSIMRSVEDEPKNIRLFSAIPDLMSKPGGLRTMLLAVCLMIVRAFSCSIIFHAYADRIFENQDYETIVLATVELISFILCISLVDRIGRRPLMIISIVGVAICSFVLGVYFCLDKENVNVENLHWLALVSVLGHDVTASVGLRSLPFVITNEIFSMYAKSAYISFCFFLYFLCSFVLINVWNIVSSEPNLYVAFWVISAVNIFGLLFLVYYLPETKFAGEAGLPDKDMRY
ncbi:uncharacterized protein LOC143356989 [Halictus rubicundus]|uniref:uncharacterized protein LOC143356989 n=1 Tax=Halictus rubicundus TaxID=77578 RepID=UPI004035F51C